MRWLRWAAAPLLPPMLAAAPTDDAGGVLSALRHGIHAHGAAARVHAAETLRALGARPLAGETDRAAQWDPRPALVYRDRALGPAYKTLTLPPRGHLHLDQTFLAGQRAEVAAAVDPSVAFDLSIATPGLRVDCAAMRSGKRCSWMPDYTARYGIDVTSRGGRAATFYIVID